MLELNNNLEKLLKYMHAHKEVQVGQSRFVCKKISKITICMARRAESYKSNVSVKSGGRQRYRQAMQQLRVACIRKFSRNMRSRIELPVHWHICMHAIQCIHPDEHSFVVCRQPPIPISYSQTHNKQTVFLRLSHNEHSAYTHTYSRREGIQNLLYINSSSFQRFAGLQLGAINGDFMSPQLFRKNITPAEMHV